MASFGPELIGDTLAACLAGAAEIAVALSRAFDKPIKVAVGGPSQLDRQRLPTGPGLAIAFHIRSSGAVAVVSAASGLLPRWCVRPDAAGQERLGRLAVELGMLLFPEEWLPETSHAGSVADLAQVIRLGEAAQGASQITLTLSDELGHTETLHLIWPAPNPAKALSAAQGEAGSASGGAAGLPSSFEETAPSKARPSPSYQRDPSGIVSEAELPSYSRSLLRIQVPLTVTLASKKQAVGRIVEIGPGAIIQFDKSCEELLELEAGGHKIALGEAVKVGDKFGIRVSSLILPEDRFVPVGERRQQP